MTYSELLPFNMKLEDTMKYMCAGDQHFFYQRLDNGTFAYTATESYEDQEGDVDARIAIATKVGEWIDEWH